MSQSATIAVPQGTLAPVAQADSPDGLRSAPRLLVEVGRLSRICEWRTPLAIAVEWAVVAIAIALWCSLPADLGVARWLVYGVCVVVIASRQHAFLILMHEGAHARISGNRTWNDVVSDLFCAFPLGLSTELYRRRHLKHHQHTNTDKDPDWTIVKQFAEWHWPMSRWKACRILAMDVSGLAGYKIIATFMLWSPARQLLIKRRLKLALAEHLRRIAFYATVVAVLTVWHLWLGFAMFWLVPLLSALVAIARYRSVAEHMVVASEHELNKTRHVDPTFIERLIVAPLNVNNHLAHHLFPSVPFYHLPELQRILMGEQVFREHAHITSTYWGLRQGVWAELTRTTPLPVAARA